MKVVCTLTKQRIVNEVLAHEKLRDLEIGHGNILCVLYLFYL